MFTGNSESIESFYDLMRKTGREQIMELNVNAKRHLVEVDPTTPLLWVLREQLGLTGTKFGCGIAACGACTVHVEQNSAKINRSRSSSRKADT